MKRDIRNTARRDEAARTAGETSRTTRASRLTDDEASRVTDEPPPVGGSWAVLYAAVLANLALLVVLFYLFTRAFR
ncbi:MAG TPA: hypothetical protein VFX96_01175 [Pyrinomonadaceae bacterium]|nr:hypothetical protein [Pyrinomonadaceae bacterium]